MRKVNIASDLATVATCLGIRIWMPTIRTLLRPIHRVIRSFSRRVASAFSFDFCCLPVVLLVLLKVQTCHRRWGFKFKHRVASRRLRSESTATVPRFPYPFAHYCPRPVYALCSGAAEWSVCPVDDVGFILRVCLPLGTFELNSREPTFNTLAQLQIVFV